ncbi:hypothetical protein CAOG_04430 [Capsaspora owczarzaki ATCC 30864]|uniref:Uncharacterized protein n=1 Tax=Capsaspora owczarzaki (strain ATCC 30864) TaxID=595528 RepID=A0A0D2UF07_CAPO3|nr:hypothetical protein CAOG_04430 [Capsaspora owczarzaki ATCC 30864]KJE93676.1 hypothetical protein CAOG_004430 [Capsaspora owczarzaki ATCC 30864]|eukprot:XP_004348258.2 hypothetical protein CAOG_04430 [Capsaspora owczarzaki ATCC 30864]
MPLLGRYLFGGLVAHDGAETQQVWFRGAERLPQLLVPVIRTKQDELLERDAPAHHAHSGAAGSAGQARRQDGSGAGAGAGAGGKSASELAEQADRDFLRDRVARCSISEVMDELAAVTAFMSFSQFESESDSAAAAATAAAAMGGQTARFQGTMGTAAAAKARTAKMKAVLAQTMSGSTAAGAAGEPRTVASLMLASCKILSAIPSHSAAAKKSGKHGASKAAPSSIPVATTEFLLQQLTHQLTQFLLEIYLAGNPTSMAESMCPLLELVTDATFPIRQVVAFDIIFNLALRLDVIVHIQRTARSGTSAQDLFASTNPQSPGLTRTARRQLSQSKLGQHFGPGDDDDGDTSADSSVDSSRTNSSSYESPGFGLGGTAALRKTSMTPTKTTDIVAFARLTLLSSLAEMLLSLVQLEVTSPDVWESAIKCVLFLAQRDARTRQRLLALVDVRLWPTLLFRTLPATQSAFAFNASADAPIVSSIAAPSPSFQQLSTGVASMRYLSPAIEGELATLWKQALFRFGSLDTSQLVYSISSIPDSGPHGVAVLVGLFSFTRSLQAKQAIFTLLFYYVVSKLAPSNSAMRADASEVTNVFEFLLHHVHAYSGFDALFKFVPERLVESVSCFLLVDIPKQGGESAGVAARLSRTVLVAVLCELEQLAVSYLKLHSTLLQSIPTVPEADRVGVLKALLTSEEPSDRNQGERWLFNLLLEPLQNNSLKLKKSSKPTPETMLLELLSSSNPKVRLIYLRICDRVLLYYRSQALKNVNAVYDVMKLCNELFGFVLLVQERDEGNLAVLVDLLFNLLCVPTETGLRENKSRSMVELFLAGEAYVSRNLLESLHVVVLQHLLDAFEAERAALLLLIIELCKASPTLLDSVGGRSYFRRLCASPDARLALHASEFLIDMFKSAHAKEYQQFLKFWADGSRAAGDDSDSTAQLLLENPYLQLNAIMEQLHSGAGNAGTTTSSSRA